MRRTESSPSQIIAPVGVKCHLARVKKVAPTGADTGGGRDRGGYRGQGQGRIQEEAGTGADRG